MEELQVGDTVQVKSWDSMVSEYGFGGIDYPDDSINTPFSFTTDMRKFCNSFFIIRSIKERNSNKTTEYFLNYQNGEMIHFFFAEEMFIIDHKSDELSLKIANNVEFDEELL